MKIIVNKNNLIIIVVVGVALLAVGFFVFQKKGPAKSTNINQVQNINQTQEKKGDIFSSIKDAISKSLSLKCEYNSGTNKTVAYVKGSSIRIDGSWQNKKNSGAIIKDNKLWSWDIDKKEGVIMPLKTDKDQKDSLNSEEIIKNLEEQKQFCQVAVVADSVFNPPADVKFQDLSEMFKNLPKSQ